MVAIPSNRVNVSHLPDGVRQETRDYIEDSRNPLESGQCFSLLPFTITPRKEEAMLVAIPSNRVNVSHTARTEQQARRQRSTVAIPSNRVNVSHKIKKNKTAN